MHLIIDNNSDYHVGFTSRYYLALLLLLCIMYYYVLVWMHL